MRLHVTALALALGLGVGTAAADEGWFGSAELGATALDRDDFRFGEVGTDSNDYAVGGYVIDTPDYERDTWGWTPRFSFGRRFASGNGFELSFKYAQWSEGDSFHHSAGDYAGMDDPEGTPFNGKNPALQIVYIDGPGDPVDSPENVDRLSRGTVGLRLTQAEADYDYDATEFQLAGGWLHRLSQSDDAEIDMIVGGSLTFFSESHDLDVAGNFSEDPTDPFDQFSELSEDVDQWLIGPRLLFRGHVWLGDNNGGSFDWAAGVDLLWRNADLDGDQEVDGNAGTFSAEVSDDESGFSPHVQAMFGFSWKAGDRVWLGFGWHGEWWGDIADVRNPEIDIQDIDGDTRWVADHAARLAADSVFIHSLLFTIRW